MGSGIWGTYDIPTDQARTYSFAELFGMDIRRQTILLMIVFFTRLRSTGVGFLDAVMVSGYVLGATIWTGLIHHVGPGSSGASSRSRSRAGSWRSGSPGTSIPRKASNSKRGALMAASDVRCVLPARALNGESPVWDERRQRLFWVDIREPALHAFPSTGLDRRWEMPAWIGCIALGAGEGVAAALRTGLYALDLESGALRFLAPSPFGPAV
jgi:SMP-30/Gluconolactonase/LRE-like region